MRILNTIRLNYNDQHSLFLGTSDYQSRFIFKKSGFTFNGILKAWVTRDVRIAGRLRQYAEGRAKEEINRAFISVRPWATPLVYNKGPLKLKEFQANIGVPWILARNRSYLAAQPGMGKTPMAAVALNTWGAPGVYLTPASLVLNVEAELKAWTKGLVIERLDPWTVPHLSPDILIVPDSIIFRPEVIEEIKAVAERARALHKDAYLVVDETHKFKNETSKRSQALFGFTDKMTKTLVPGLITFFPKQTYMSGTPMPNRLIELWPTLEKVAPETIKFMNKHRFGMHYCGGYPHNEECKVCDGEGSLNGRPCYKCDGMGKLLRGYRYDGTPKTERLEEFEKNLKARFMLRLYKRDHLKELPAKTEEIVIIGDGPAKLIGMDSRVLREHSPTDLMESQFDTPYLSTYRRMLGEYKLKSALQFILEEIEATDEAFLIFGYHTKVIEGLISGLQKYSPLVITGKNSTKQRDRAVKLFQAEKKHRVMVLNYIAGGLGHTLTKATRGIFVEFDWVPEAVNDQASDRMHRIGQLKTVHLQYLVFANSLDKTMMDMNFRKRRVTGYV